MNQYRQQNGDNTKWSIKLVLPGIIIAGSFLVGAVVSIFGWLLIDDASIGFLVVNVAFLYAIIHYIVVGIAALFRKIFGGGKKEDSSTNKIKLDAAQNDDDGWH